jgi:hypothetical protein
MEKQHGGQSIRFNWELKAFTGSYVQYVLYMPHQYSVNVHFNLHECSRQLHFMQITAFLTTRQWRILLTFSHVIPLSVLPHPTHAQYYHSKKFCWKLSPWIRCSYSNLVLRNDLPNWSKQNVWNQKIRFSKSVKTLCMDELVLKLVRAGHFVWRNLS